MSTATGMSTATSTPGRWSTAWPGPIGHLERVKAMVEEGRDCSEVLIQLAAVRSALNNTGKVILKDHLEHCIVEAVENHDHATIEELNRAIEQFVK